MSSFGLGIFIFISLCSLCYTDDALEQEYGAAIRTLASLRFTTSLTEAQMKKQNELRDEIENLDNSLEGEDAVKTAEEQINKLKREYIDFVNKLSEPPNTV